MVRIHTAQAWQRQDRVSMVRARRHPDGPGYRFRIKLLRCRSCRPLRMRLEIGEAGSVQPGTRPVELVGFFEVLLQHLLYFGPNPMLLPVVHPPPAGHSAATAHLSGQQFPGNARTQYEKNTGQRVTVRNARPSPFWPRRFRWQQGLDHFPQPI